MFFCDQVSCIDGPSALGMDRDHKPIGVSSSVEEHDVFAIGQRQRKGLVTRSGDRLQLPGADVGYVDVVRHPVCRARACEDACRCRPLSDEKLVRPPAPPLLM